MATTFESIYARCRGRIKDYDKEGYTDEMFAAVEKTCFRQQLTILQISVLMT